MPNCLQEMRVNQEKWAQVENEELWAEREAGGEGGISDWWGALLSAASFWKERAVTGCLLCLQLHPQLFRITPGIWKCPAYLLSECMCQGLSNKWVCFEVEIIYTYICVCM